MGRERLLTLECAVERVSVVRRQRPEDALKRISACCPLRSRLHPFTPSPLHLPPCVSWHLYCTPNLQQVASLRSLYVRFPWPRKVSLQFPKQFSLGTHTNTLPCTHIHTHTFFPLALHSDQRKLL